MKKIIYSTPQYCATECKKLRVYSIPEGEGASVEEIKLASATPAFLSLVLGKSYRRRRLMKHRINWDRVLLLSIDGKTAGYLQYYLEGKGPHQPVFSDMRDEYGPLNAAWRFSLYSLLHWRIRRCEAYLYRVVLKEPFRGQGFGRLLVEQWLYMMDNAGVKTVDLDVWGSNETAQALYTSLGFEVRSRYALPISGGGFRSSRLIRMVRSQ